MDAVVPGGAGGVAVPTTEGRTAARGDPSLPSSAPVGDNDAPPPAADVTEVERAPRARRQPSAEEIRALYPARAREERLEQDVRVDLLVSERGAVAQVRVRSGGGDGFGEAAAEVARRIAFDPATRGGRPVAVWIPWTVKFRLDG
jgi:TonB family protein